MNPEVTPDHRSRAAELSVWQSELAEIDRAVERHESFKAQTFVFGTGGTILLISSAFEYGASGDATPRPLVLLLVTFVCAFLGMFLVDRDEAILALLRYRESVIKPKIRELVDTPDVLGSWEFFNRESYGMNRPLLRKVAHLLTAPFPHALFFVSGVASFGYLVYLRIASDSISGTPWGLGIGVAALALLYAWTGAFLTGGQWAQLGSPLTERGIPFLRRRVRSRLPRPDGWAPGDPHAHTNWSDGWRSIWSQAERAARQGLAWMALADHSDGIGDDWHAYVAAIDEVEHRIGGLTLVPGAEVTVVDQAGGSASGDLLIFGWPPNGCPPPKNRASQGFTILQQVAAQQDAFGVVAHPYGGGAPMNRGFRGTTIGAARWTDWDVPAPFGLELLSHERRANDSTVRAWFDRIERFGTSPALGGTDSHVPWDAPASRGMTWIRIDRSQVRDRDAIVDALRTGRCVVSGVGDFATISLMGAGPGDVVPTRPAAVITVTCEQRPARGRHCIGVTLFGGLEGADRSDGLRVLAEDSGPFESVFDLNVGDVADSPFVVSRFTFARVRGAGGGMSEVWTNPVFIAQRTESD